MRYSTSFTMSSAPSEPRMRQGVEVGPQTLKGGKLHLEEQVAQGNAAGLHHDVLGVEEVESMELTEETNWSHAVSSSASRASPSGVRS